MEAVGRMDVSHRPRRIELLKALSAFVPFDPFCSFMLPPNICVLAPDNCSLASSGPSVEREICRTDLFIFEEWGRVVLNALEACVNFTLAA